MRNRIWLLTGLVGSMLSLIVMSACTAEPPPIVKAPTLQPTSADQLSTLQPTPAGQLPTRQPTLAGQLPTLQPTRSAQIPTASAADRTAIVQRGTIRTGVNGLGKLEPVKNIKLSFGVPGIVKEILVNEGQSVKAGDVLARLDTGELEQAVNAAQQALANQQLAYSLVITPTRSEVAAARAVLAGAKANLAGLQSLPDPQQVEIARLQAELAKEGARQPQPGQIADLQYALAQRGSSAEQIAAANVLVAQAQAQLDKLLLTDARQRALAAVPLKQAELDLQAAQRRLESAQLISPIDGVLSSLTPALGDHVDTNPVAVVSDMSAFNVAFVVDEANVGLLANQQPAVIAVAVLPTQTLSGQVKSIAPLATETAGVTGYKVIIGLDQSDAPVRGGMSANIAIVVGASDNVLIIPSWAIRTDRNTSKTYAYVKRGGQVEETEIVTGRYDLNQIEVKSGLAEGEVLVAPPKGSP